LRQRLFAYIVIPKRVRPIGLRLRRFFADRFCYGFPAGRNGIAARAIKDTGRAGKAFSTGWNVTPDQIAALKNGTQIALYDQNWPQQAAFGAIACASFFKHGKVLPNTQQLTVITKANLKSAQAKLADIKTYALNGLPTK